MLAHFEWIGDEEAEKKIEGNSKESYSSLDENEHRSGNSGCCIEGKGMPDTAEVTDMVMTSAG